MPDPESGAANGRLRVVLAGLGAMGSHHLRILSSLPEVELVAVVDPSAPRREGCLVAHPALRAYESLEPALAEHELDFAALAVPLAELPGCARCALEAGLHVFAEKPLAATEGEARALVASAAERSLVLAVGYVERFNPAVVALKEKLAAGAIGAIVQMHARRLSPFPNRAGMAGAALDLATHDLDLMRYLSGSEIASVYAELVMEEGRGEDLVCATLRFDSGATGLLEANWITPTKVRELTVLGEGGMFIVNYLTQDLTFFEHPTKQTEWSQLAGMRGGGEGDMIRYALERREPLRVQWESFVAAVRGSAPLRVDGSDGVAALSSARAIQVSGAEHRVMVPSYREAAVV